MSANIAPRTVAELMTQDPVLAVADMSLHDAAELMEFYRVSALPVIDWDGCLVGVISQTDLLHARVTKALWQAWPGLTVRHLMTHPAVTVTSDSDVDEAAELMERLHIHRLVVIDADGESPIGVLSLTDLVRSMAEREVSGRPSSCATGHDGRDRLATWRRLSSSLARREADRSMVTFRPLTECQSALPCPCRAR